MPIGEKHHPTDRLYVFVRNAFVEQVAHGIDKNHPWLPPTKRFCKFVGDQTQVESKFKGVPLHSAESFCKGLCVAVFTSRTHFGAAPDWIPGSIRPLNLCPVSHL